MMLVCYNFNMKLIKILLTALLILLGIGFLIGISVYLEFKTVPPSPDQNNTTQQAIDRRDVSQCDTLSMGMGDSNPRLNCYIDVAVATGDVSLCEKYPDDYGIETDHCRQAVASERNDPALCRDDNYCIFLIAQQRKDIHTCDLIDRVNPNQKIWTREKCVSGVKDYIAAYPL